MRAHFFWLVFAPSLLSCSQRDDQGKATADAGTQEPARLEAGRPLQCQKVPCNNFDALVFVHGIYGGHETFYNSRTGFDWPRMWPQAMPTDAVGGLTHVDVYVIEYRSAFASWARGDNPAFEDVAKTVFQVMAPLRKKQYRSIGFIAHSLGGNIVSTYIQMVNNRYGHAHRAENAFLITLATPVIGAQIADVFGFVKRRVFINDHLLKSLESGNLYLTMLNEFRSEVEAKAEDAGCRAVHLHAAIEEKYLGPVLVVTPQSAGEAISKMVNSPVVGFRLNHLEMAKPTGPNDPLYTWVMDRVEDEYSRMSDWQDAHANVAPEFFLCQHAQLLPGDK
jgi:pimeloyl-ACP methyl ester carboxylesterase